MELRQIEAPVHGRVLFEEREHGLLLVGFHGYAETAGIHMEALRRLPDSKRWSLAAIQALHPFYLAKTGAVVAGWMTSEDRELAIGDNIEYVRRVLATLPNQRRIVFLGFSQGVAMAFRAAAFAGASPAGVIGLGADMPTDVIEARPRLPPALIARGTRDEWYTAEKFERDLAFLRGVTEVDTCVFEGGHEWSDRFLEVAGEFLSRVAR
ncbi:MAG: phospholipase [Thermoanaerobaculia bacterium]|nr:phospholipase [Thermoanaerobaculia bacterium]